MSDPPAARSADPAGVWPIPVVVRHDNGSFSLVSDTGIRPIAMPRGDWWLAGSAPSAGVLLLPVDVAAVDAALVTVAEDGTTSLARAIGNGSRVAGAGCVSPAADVALAGLDDLALEVVDRDGERRPIHFDGHRPLGECAWLGPDALVTPAHDRSLLYFHRAGGQGEQEVHAATFPGVRGRYPAAGGGRLAMTTGDADDEAVTLWQVGPIERDSATPPTLDPIDAFQSGDGPRRGEHAVSADGTLLAVAGSRGGRPALWLYDLQEGSPSGTAIALPRLADRIVFLAPPDP